MARQKFATRLKQKSNKTKQKQKQLQMVKRVKARNGNRKRELREKKGDEGQEYQTKLQN